MTGYSVATVTRVPGVQRGRSPGLGLTPARTGYGSRPRTGPYLRARGPEGLREGLEVVVVGRPVAVRSGPVQRVGVGRVGQHVPVQDVHRDAVAVVGELPVG